MSSAQKSFTPRIFSVNITKSTTSCGFGHTYGWNQCNAWKYLSTRKSERFQCDKSNIHKPRALNLKDCRKSTQRLKVSKHKEIHDFLRIWSHLRVKSLIENFIFCGVIWKIVDINTVSTSREIASTEEGSWGNFTFDKIIHPLQGWKLSLFQNACSSERVPDAGRKSTCFFIKASVTVNYK